MTVRGDTGVCPKSVPPERRPLGMLACKTPNQGVESSFPHWVAWPMLPEKDIFFTDAGIAPGGAHVWFSGFSRVVPSAFATRQSLHSVMFGSGDDTFGNPHRAHFFNSSFSSSNFSIRVFRADPLVEIRQAVPCRAIRGDSISVNSTLPPLSNVCDCPSL